MPEEIKEEEVVVEEEVKEPKEEKKGFFGKAKAAILPDADEQAAIISTMVRITVLAWSGGILTLFITALPAASDTDPLSLTKTSALNLISFSSLEHQ